MRDNIIATILSVLILGMIGILWVLVINKRDSDKIEKRLFSSKKNPKRKRPFYCFLKRVFDVCFAAVGIIIFLPLLMIVYFAQKKSGIKEVFKRLECQGYKGNKAVYYVFNEKNQNDELTPIGQVIHKMGLTMFPVYFSILKGDLTFVGLTREIRNIETENYPWLYDFEKPGLISAGKAIENEKSQEEIDVLYLKERSVLLDIQIILTVIAKVLNT